MKILFLQFPLEPAWGGAEEQTVLLARGLAGAGNKIELISSNRELVAVFKKSGIVARYFWLGWEPTSVKALVLFPITWMISSLMFLAVLAFGGYRTIF
jgi:hypothetical protein